jgi:hypothetical protein
MAGWRVHAETPDGVATEEAQLERFAESLEQNDDALGAAASMDSGRGTLSATFHVEARPSCRRPPGRRSGSTCMLSGMPTLS